MLEWLADSNPFESLETTIAPSNNASKSLFQTFAEKRGLSIIQEPFLDSFEDTSGEVHEEENIFRLTP